jgi:hypothetical protein
LIDESPDIFANSADWRRERRTMEKTITAVLTIALGITLAIYSKELITAGRRMLGA